jgi:hypothetical protein
MLDREEKLRVLDLNLMRWQVLEHFTGDHVMDLAEA